MSGSNAPLDPLTPNDQGAAVVIVSYFLIVATLSFSTVRWAIGRSRLLQLDADDACFAASVGFGIATSILSHVQVTAGLGRHQDTITPHEVRRYFKFQYASQFTAVCAIALAKVSILLLFRRIMSQSKLVAAFFTLASAIAFYFVFSIFATAFECGLPRPWLLDPDVCPTHGRFLYAIIVMNMLTDGLLAIWILPSLWKLQMSRSQRLVVVSLFAARFVVIGTAIGQIVLTARSLGQEDQTWFALPRNIMDQVVVHLSIIHATFPRIHGFLSNLQTGMLATRITADIQMMGSKDYYSAKNNGSNGSANASQIGNAGRAGSRNMLKSASSQVVGGKTHKKNGMLYVSSSSHDYPSFYDEKAGDDPREAAAATIAAAGSGGSNDGNMIGGIKLRPDIVPGSKWQTHIYADPSSSSSATPYHRQQSSDRSAGGDLAMGSQVDREGSTSSLTERNGFEDGSSAPPRTRSAEQQQQQQQQKIWKTNEFRMQIESVKAQQQQQQQQQQQAVQQAQQRGNQQYNYGG